MRQWFSSSLSVLGAALIGAGCGAAVDSAEDGYAGEEVWEEELGESEQALMRVSSILGDGAGVATTFDPAPPEPPPPPPPPEEEACVDDPQAELIAALGLRALTYFGRVDPGVWECDPGVADCRRVRLSAALRSQNQTAQQLEKIAKVEELLAMLDELGAMARFANMYRDAVAACQAASCPATPQSFNFSRAEPDECGGVRVSISQRSQHGDVMGNVIGGGGVLAQASAPVTSTPPVRATVAGGTALFSLSSGRFQAAGGAPLASTGGSREESGSVSSERAAAAATAALLVPFYRLYGNPNKDCDPAQGEMCNGYETDTVIKTYLDHTCEGTSTSDACHSARFDGTSFYHSMIGTAVAVSERLNEKCKFRAMVTSDARDGRIKKRSAASRVLTCIY